jgi:TM2 domain-containing membrane protein YozV
MSTGSDFSEADHAQAQYRPYPDAQQPVQGDANAQFGALPQQYAPQGPAAPQWGAAPQVILPKNPALGVILSFFIPGLGSMVNGSGGRGAVILILYTVGWILSLVLIGIPILIGAWIWGLVDGFLSAQRWNAAHGIVS